MTSIREYTIGGELRPSARRELVQALLQVNACRSRANARDGCRASKEIIDHLIDRRPATPLIVYSAQTLNSDPILDLCKRHLLACRIQHQADGAGSVRSWVVLTLPASKGHGTTRREATHIHFYVDANGKPIIDAYEIEKLVPKSEDGLKQLPERLRRLAGDMNMAANEALVPPLSTENTWTYEAREISDIEDAAAFQRTAPIKDVIPTWRAVSTHGGTLFGLYRGGNPVAMFSLRPEAEGEVIAMAVGVADMALLLDEREAVDSFISRRAEEAIQRRTEALLHKDIVGLPSATGPSP